MVQLHHISYDPDWSVPVYQGEHYAITLLNRRKRVSLGAIISLKHFVAKWEHRAEHLKYPVES